MLNQAANETLIFIEGEALSVVEGAPFEADSQPKIGGGGFGGQSLVLSPIHAK
jgi:hypothetical protein